MSFVVVKEFILKKHPESGGMGIFFFKKKKGKKATHDFLREEILMCIYYRYVAK